MNVSVDQSILHVTMVVATHLLRNEAILLSDAYYMFTQSITESSTLPQITPNATLSNHAFHKHLISSLQEQLECRTVEQSVGIILYRKGGDHLVSISETCLPFPAQSCVSPQPHSSNTSTEGTGQIPAIEGQKRTGECRVYA